MRTKTRSMPSSGSVSTYAARPDRLTAVGYGMTKPLAPNKTKRGRDMNRRVAFAIVQ